jgi:FMN phosphatase YigB (HAD superfamily)
VRVVLLDFDGTCYQGDLPVQAYARRVAELLDAERATFVIGAMRAFLEGKPPPQGAPPEFDTAEDGYELVRALARQTGIDEHDRRVAYQRSRDDLARSAFALDAESGLVDWLEAIKPDTTVWLATLAPLTGISEVLDAVGLAALVDRLHPRTPKPEGLADLAAAAVALTGDPAGVLAIGDRWAADLAPIHDIGGRTAHLDRYDRRLGTPTWRATRFAAMLADLQRWAADPRGAIHAG